MRTCVTGDGLNGKIKAITVRKIEKESMAQFCLDCTTELMFFLKIGKVGSCLQCTRFGFPCLSSRLLVSASGCAMLPSLILSMLHTILYKASYPCRPVAHLLRRACTTSPRHVGFMIGGFIFFFPLVSYKEGLGVISK